MIVCAWNTLLCISIRRIKQQHTPCLVAKSREVQEVVANKTLTWNQSSAIISLKTVLDALNILKMFDIIFLAINRQTITFNNQLISYTINYVVIKIMLKLFQIYTYDFCNLAIREYLALRKITTIKDNSMNCSKWTRVE